MPIYNIDIIRFKYNVAMETSKTAGRFGKKNKNLAILLYKLGYPAPGKANPNLSLVD